MNRNKLLQIIQKDLQELASLNAELTASETLSKFEIELALSKANLIRQEYEYLQELFNAESQNDALIQPQAPKVIPEETVPEPEVKLEEPPVIEEPIAEIPTEKPSPKEEEVAPKKEAPVVESELNEEPAAPEPTPEIPVQEVTETVTVSPEPVAVPEPAKVLPSGNGHQSAPLQEKKFLTEQFQSQSLNDIMAGVHKMDQHFANTPIAKLETAVGLNDRFQYIRELFENDAELYRQTVTKIDSFAQLDEAIAYLDQHFNWEKDDTSVKFLHLIKRRFSA